MKIVVVGGTGLIGRGLVTIFRGLGHVTVVASPSTGINAVTGEGLAAALAGAETVVDVSNSPSFEDRAVLEFFEKSTRNLMAAEVAAGIKHHVALSVVGADRIPDSGYMRAKVAQEALIKAAGVPYTILRATQFFEFLGSIAGPNAGGEAIRMPRALMQPVAAEDVVRAVADVALAAPVNGTVELAGPEAVPIADLMRRYLRAQSDPRRVVTDEDAGYFGARLENGSLVPENGSQLGTVRLEQWLVDN